MSMSLNSGFKPLQQVYPQQIIHITCNLRNQITVQLSCDHASLMGQTVDVTSA